MRDLADFSADSLVPPLVKTVKVLAFDWLKFWTSPASEILGNLFKQALDLLRFILIISADFVSLFQIYILQEYNNFDAAASYVGVVEKVHIHPQYKSVNSLKKSVYSIRR